MMFLYKPANITTRLRSILVGSEQSDWRSGIDILRFLAIMLILTILVRGTSSVTMPVVTVTTPYQGTVSHSFTMSGEVSVETGTPLTIPEGLLVEQVLVQAGDKVTTGQPLAIVSMEDIEDALAENQASLQDLRVQASQLLEGNSADPFQYQQAQQQLDRAYDNYNKTVNESEQDIAEAEEELEAARQNLEAVQSKEPLTPADSSVQSMATPEQAQISSNYEAWESELEAAKSSVQQAEDNLDATKEAASNSQSAALSAAQSAEDSRNSAQHSYEKDSETIADTNQADRASAQTLLAQISEKEKLVTRLEQLQDSEGQYQATSDGVLTEISLVVGEDTTAVAGLLSTGEDGYIVTASLSSDQIQLVNNGGTITVSQGQTTGTATLQSLGNDGTVQFNLQGEQWETGNATITFTNQGNQSGMCLPSTAVNSDNSGDFVYLVETKNTVLGAQNVLTRLAVTVDERGDGTVRVSGALSGEEKIVSGSSKPLSSGAKVRIES